MLPKIPPKGKLIIVTPNSSHSLKLNVSQIKNHNYKI